MQIIIEGQDCVGKSTQIAMIKKALKQICFITTNSIFVKQDSTEDYIDYSKKTFDAMFKVFECNSKNGYGTIADRAHIGEMVYSPIFRNYSGDFVLDIEEKFLYIPDMFLILFIDTPENLIARDDGLSFSIDPIVKQKEQDLFIEAVNKSKIKNKIIIDVNGKTPEEVNKEVIDFIKSKVEGWNI